MCRARFWCRCRSRFVCVRVSRLDMLKEAADVASNAGLSQAQTYHTAQNNRHELLTSPSAQQNMYIL